MAKHRQPNRPIIYDIRYYKWLVGLTCAKLQKCVRILVGRSAAFLWFRDSPLFPTPSLTGRQLQKDEMAVCLQCGTEDNSGYITKRVNRGSEQLCSSCAARPAKIVNTKYGKCRPWHGDFDEWENPLNKYGELYRPGVRLCGYRDCIEKTHIQTKK
jgi:hypothetical protein